MGATIPLSLGHDLSPQLGTCHSGTPEYHMAYPPGVGYTVQLQLAEIQGPMTDRGIPMEMAERTTQDEVPCMQGLSLRHVTETAA